MLIYYIQLGMYRGEFNMKKNSVPFRFVGRGSSYLNDRNYADIVKDTCNYVGVKLVNEGNGYGKSQNVVVLANAKKGNYGYDEEDILARFDDADRCNTFINGMYAMQRIIKRKKR